MQRSRSNRVTIVQCLCSGRAGVVHRSCTIVQRSWKDSAVALERSFNVSGIIGRAATVSHSCSDRATFVQGSCIDRTEKEQFRSQEHPPRPPHNCIAKYDRARPEPFLRVSRDQVPAPRQRLRERELELLLGLKPSSTIPSFSTVATPCRSSGSSAILASPGTALPSASAVSTPI